MTALPDTDDRARRVATGRVLRRALVLAGLVACALLLAVGFARASGHAASGHRAGAVVAQVQAIDSEAGPSPGRALGWTVAEIDDVSGDPRVVEPAPGALPHPSVAGFPPWGESAPPVRTSALPDRPPRRS